MRWRGCAGQATVEVVAAIPLLVAVAAAALAVLAAGRASAAAERAARAGAAAIVRGGDGARAAQEALEDWRRVRVRVRDGRVRVRVWPSLPLFADRLAASAVADAGPAPPAPARPETVRGGDGLAAAPATGGGR